MTKRHKFGLIGYNTAYSKSPEVFRVIFAVRNVSGTFENFNLEPSHFEEGFRELLTNGLQGLSVTIPYKNRVIPLLDEVDPVATALGAVNSVSVDNNLVIGFNTDCFGFSLPLRSHSEKLKHGRALVFGCGGGAKAAVYSLYTDYEVKRFTVLGRSSDRLEDFRRSLHDEIEAIDIEVESFARSGKGSGDYDIVVNCTPLGGWNHPGDVPFPKDFSWLPGKIYYDLNYNDGNRAICLAAGNKMLAINGSSMLVGQAIRSFNIWTGMDVPFAGIYEAVFGRG